ncbi:hypothetical protein AVEN_146692-1 [Araneus ventricosus]|uniref:Uncharacterized protein n=1 Tax=Araneus ventricosus TaxID=182803 RepID=A0A4Y2BV54_ARAVE|nr:hypothetical protein AVEN_146692-1 [Araneus ventricosus]
MMSQLAFLHDQIELSMGNAVPFVVCSGCRNDFSQILNTKLKLLHESLGGVDNTPPFSREIQSYSNKNIDIEITWGKEVNQTITNHKKANALVKVQPQGETVLK